jgi:hypothetical protein
VAGVVFVAGVVGHERWLALKNSAPRSLPGIAFEAAAADGAS